MTTYLVTSKDKTSEWKNTIIEVQEELDMLEKIGVVNNVKAQKFEDNYLTKEITFNYNGSFWEKVV